MSRVKSKKIRNCSNGLIKIKAAVLHPPISANGFHLIKMEPITTCENPSNFPRLSLDYICSLEALLALSNVKFDIVTL